MIYDCDYVEEEAVLLPIDTRFSIEAYLESTDDLMEPNKKGEYSFSFYPCTYQDYQKVQEVAAHAKSRVELCTSMYSRKTPELVYEGSTGEIFTSQLSPAKLNIPINPWDVPVLRGKQVSLNLRFTDTKIGKIYLVCDYCDLYEDPRVEPDGATAGDEATYSDNDW